MSAGRLFVFGAGGHGKVVADVGRSAGFEVAGFIDDDPARPGSMMLGAPVLSWQRILSEPQTLRSASLALAVGDNLARQRCSERIAAAGFSLVSLVHATAAIAPTAVVGVGSVIMALVAVNPGAVIGDGAILNTGCVVEHDCTLGAFVHMSPNAVLGGSVRVGDRAHIGLGAVALPGISIGADVRVGAGAVVVRDVPAGLTVVGVPAKPLERMR